MTTTSLAALPAASRSTGSARRRATTASPADGRGTDVLLSTLSGRSPTLRDHLVNVADLAEAVSRAHGLPEADVLSIGLAAELHDVGKMAISPTILDKRGSLSAGEWVVMKQHTVIGERIIRRSRSDASLASVAQIVRSSHERHDGTGYPDGLCAGEINVGARIVAVCDAYDAMRSDRVYSRSRSHADALAELSRCAGTQFDPAIVELFCLTVERRDLTDKANPPRAGARCQEPHSVRPPRRP